jgi:hypothetical protein
MFSNALVEVLHIKLKMSFPSHPETDGQTERVNQMLKCYLWNYCNYNQDNWAEILPMAEYAYNNSLTTTAGISPFIANFEFDSQTNWPIEAEVKHLESRNVVHWMTSVHTLCCRSVDTPQGKFEKYYNKHAKEPPKYSVGD